MSKLNIAVLPGDGIGPEITEQALNVTKAICLRILEYLLRDILFDRNQHHTIYKRNILE